MRLCYTHVCSCARACVYFCIRLRPFTLFFSIGLGICSVTSVYLCSVVNTLCLSCVEMMARDRFSVSTVGGLLIQ